MRCEKIVHKFNDLLDMTLSAVEEHEVQAHLVACPDCRDKFQLVKNADDMLRATVLEMVAEIEVPSNLSQRIGQILAGEKKRQHRKAKLFGLLQAPAFAAAMLVLVVATGLFGYYKLFDPSRNNPSVVLSLPQSQSVSESAADTEPAPLSGAGQEQATVKGGTTTDAKYKAASPLVTEKTPVADDTIVIMQDADNLDAEAIARQNAPSGLGSGDYNKTIEKAATDLAQDPITEEQSIPMASSQSSGTAKMFTMSDRATSQRGTLQEATREVGFTPTVPGYLPPEAELKDVTWEPGTVRLEYLADRNSFMLTQSRVAEVGTIGEEGGQLIELNGAKAHLQENSTDGDQSWGYTTVRWQRGEWVFMVDGDLPREEILKIALSIN
ncbi:MAG: zf-HC2 domain-containing protein [Desulfotomaculaceae bacterium]|nr:zf-HC2 domain-containing protein [Desulfotomaculaceae bacterium]